MNTPADKPDMPPKRPAGVDETMRDLRSAFIDVRIHAMRASTLCEYIELLERKVADERRKALNKAARLADRLAAKYNRRDGDVALQIDQLADSIRDLIDKE